MLGSLLVTQSGMVDIGIRDQADDVIAPVAVELWAETTSSFRHTHSEPPQART